MADYLVNKELWCTLLKENYSRMQSRHKKLWQFVFDFIRQNSIKSVIEIGSGMSSKIPEMIERYYAVDINEKTDAIHEDFTKMDVFGLPACDMLLACGVIEHCPDYEDFFRQIGRLNPKFALISFFLGLSDKEEHETSPNRGFWAVKFSRPKLLQLLEKTDWQYEFVKPSRHDEVLILRRTNGL